MATARGQIRHTVCVTCGAAVTIDLTTGERIDADRAMKRVGIAGRFDFDNLFAPEQTLNEAAYNWLEELGLKISCKNDHPIDPRQLSGKSFLLVAMIGPSGSGKTSYLRSLVRASGEGRLPPSYTVTNKTPKDNVQWADALKLLDDAHKQDLAVDRTRAERDALKLPIVLGVGVPGETEDITMVFVDVAGETQNEIVVPENAERNLHIAFADAHLYMIPPVAGWTPEERRAAAISLSRNGTLQVAETALTAKAVNGVFNVVRDYYTNVRKRPRVGMPLVTPVVVLSKSDFAGHDHDRLYVGNAADSSATTLEELARHHDIVHRYIDTAMSAVAGHIDATVEDPWYVAVSQSGGPAYMTEDGAKPVLDELGEVVNAENRPLRHAHFSPRGLFNPLAAILTSRGYMPREFTGNRIYPRRGFLG